MINLITLISFNLFYMAFNKENNVDINHRKFNSIDNHYNLSMITKIFSTPSIDDEWIAMEKIDGSNFAFYYNGETMKHGYRTNMIKDGEKFQGYEAPAEKYNDDIKIIYDICKTTHDIDYVIVYGELFGGYYDHPDVPKNKKSVKIIGRVNYTPNTEFMFFDIVVVLKDKTEKWLSQIEIDNIESKLKLLKQVPVLYKGKLTDFITIDNSIIPKIPTRYPSVIYKEFGLPEIENNYSEGYVLKPVNTTFFDNGSRIIIKMKDDAFSEKKQTKINLKFDTEELTKFSKVADYLTEERLVNILSKLPDAKRTNDKKNTGIILSAFVTDALNDFIKDNDLDVSKDIYKHVTKSMSGSAYKIVNSFMNK